MDNPQEIPKADKIDKRKERRAFPTKTILTLEQENELVDDIVNCKAVWFLKNKYHIAERAINNISNKHSEAIDKKRQQLTIAHEKVFVPLMIAKRHKALEGVSDNDIEKASLAAKGGFIRDITQTERLVAGKSTENVQVISADMDRETLEDYIRNGNKDVTSKE